MSPEQAEEVLGLAPIDIDLIVAVRQKNQPEIARLIKIIQTGENA